MKKRVRMLHTGGTLGMVGGDPGPLMPGSEPYQALISKIPELPDIADVRIDVLARQDSCDVRAPQWVEWAQVIRRDDWADGIVLIHGTDTMVHTASTLSFLLEERERPVVLTGSQRPLGALRTDARQNLVDALILACGPTREVMICFDSQGLRGNRALKRSSAAMGAFECPGMDPLVSLGVEIVWHPHALVGSGLARKLRLSDQVKLSWIMPDLPAPTPWLPGGPSVHVLAALGSGNFPLGTGWQHTVEQEALAGVTHLVVSQCPHGGVRAGLYAASQAIFAQGAVSGGDMTWVAAVAKSRVGLAQGLHGVALEAYLLASVAGERSQ